METEPSPGQHRGEVLVVEDTPASLKLLSDLLTEAGYQVRQAPNGELALWTARSRPPELILLDVRMPGIDGFEVCRRLKATPELEHVPVIFLSAEYDTDDKVRGFQVGAADFIGKPFQAEEILARTDVHVRRLRAEQALVRERRSPLAAAAMFMLDPHGTVVSVNAAGQRWTGQDSADLVGSPLSVLGDEFRDEAKCAAFWQSLRSGQWSGPVSLRHPHDGVQATQLTVSEMRDRTGAVSHYLALLTARGA